MLINLNETEARFVIYAMKEVTKKLEDKFASKDEPTFTVNAVESSAPTVRLTKSGRPYKKLGRKPGSKVVKKVIEPQQVQA